MPTTAAIQESSMASATWNLSRTRTGFVKIRRAAIAVGTALVVVASLPVLGRLSTSDLLTLGLLAAVLWVGAVGGISGGGVAAVTATAAYTLLRVPDLLDGVGSESVAIRALAFALVGMGSGLVISRLKATFDQLTSSGYLDLESSTFSPPYIHEMVRLLTEEHKRYGKSFGLIEIPPVLSADETAQIGPALRRSTRASDVAGRSWDGGFLVLLPNTDKNGSAMVTQRLEKEIQREPKIPVRTHSVPEDIDLVEQLGFEIRANQDPALDSG